MITSIAAGPYLTVSGGSPPTTYINNYSNACGVGNMRYNNQHIEIYDGNNWITMQTGHANITLDHTAVAAISWAMNKMAEEANIQRMAHENPAVKIAYENMLKAAEELKITMILSQDENKTTS